MPTSSFWHSPPYSYTKPSSVRTNLINLKFMVSFWRLFSSKNISWFSAKVGHICQTLMISLVNFYIKYCLDLGFSFGTRDWLVSYSDSNFLLSGDFAPLLLVDAFPPGLQDRLSGVFDWVLTPNLLSWLGVVSMVIILLVLLAKLILHVLVLGWLHMDWSSASLAASIWIF